MIGNGFALKSRALMATNILGITFLEDHEGVQTRINERPTVQLILVTSVDKNNLTLLNGEQVNVANDLFRVQAARALHKNLVKVPKSIFAVAKVMGSKTSRYVKGEQTIAEIQLDGIVKIADLKADYTIYWHNDRGLEIRRGKKREIDHESCE